MIINNNYNNESYSNYGNEKTKKYKTIQQQPKKIHQLR